MRLLLDSTTYGNEKYFHYYLMEGGKLIDAKWSKAFDVKAKIDSIDRRLLDEVK